MPAPRSPPASQYSTTDDFSCFASAPPDNYSGGNKCQWQEDQESKQNKVLRAASEFEIAVQRWTRLDRDQRVVAREPVDNVYTQVEIAAIAKKGVGKEVTISYYYHTLCAIVDVTLQRDCDVDR